MIPVQVHQQRCPSTTLYNYQQKNQIYIYLYNYNIFLVNKDRIQLKNTTNKKIADRSN